MRHIYFGLGLITGFINSAVKTDSEIAGFITIGVAVLVMNIIHSIHSRTKKRTERTSTTTEQEGRMQLQQLKVGEIYPGGCPAEEPVAQIRGGAFNVTLFQPDLTATHIKLFKKHPLQTGVYIHESTAAVPVPFFIVKWRATHWFFDVPLNLTGRAGKGGVSLSKEGNIIVLILCDYPSGRVRAMRAISIAQETMRRIKKACEQQTTTAAINVCH